MMIITDCPLCGKDFMYDPNNCQELIRPNMPLNTGDLSLNEDDLDEHDDYIVICQDCNEKH